MKSTVLATWMVGLVSLAAGAFAAAQTPTATFSAIDDANVATLSTTGLFSVATSVVDPLNHNNLLIGIDRFQALNSGPINALDTISFNVQAPSGYYIANVTYSTNGASNIGRVGVTGARASWIVDGMAADLGSRRFSALPGAQPSPWSLSGRFDFTAEQQKTSLVISVTNSMVAATTGTVGSASMSTLRAEVLVGLAAIPN